MKPTSILRLALSSSLALFCLAATGCDDDESGSKTVCEQAGDVLVNDCGFEEEGGSGGQTAACEGDVAAAAQCIVDNPAETCEAFENLLDPEFSNSYTECATAAAGG